MKKELTLIINPISGTKKKRDIESKLTKRLADMGYNVTCRLTERAGHATELAREAVEGGADIVAVCGGDGTINETATAMCGTGVPMAIIPNGSGNGLARHLRIPIDIKESADVISKDVVQECDCGVVNGRPFFCTFGIGFDAEVAHRFAKAAGRGFSTYLKSAIDEFGVYTLRKYRLNVDGREIEREAFLVACCNASQYGNNSFIAPQASVDDGLLDIVIIKTKSGLNTLQAGLDVMIGMVSFNKHIEVIKARKVTIDYSEPMHAHIDGEPISMPEHMEVECKPKQLRICVPFPERKFTPIITPFNLTLRDIGLAIKHNL